MKSFRCSENDAAAAATTCTYVSIKQVGLDLFVWGGVREIQRSYHLQTPNLKSTASFAQLFHLPLHIFYKESNDILQSMICERGEKIGGELSPISAILEKQGVNFELIEHNGYLTDYRFLFTLPSIYPFQVDYCNIKLLISPRLF